MELFAQIVDGFQPSTIYPKRPILDLWEGSKDASVYFIVIFFQNSDF